MSPMKILSVQKIEMKNSTEKVSCKSDLFYARLNIAQHEDSLIDL